jgi:hypothetical protein
MEDGTALPFALCDDSEALRESPVLEALESFIRGLERLPTDGSQEMGWRESLGGYCDLGG